MCEDVKIIGSKLIVDGFLYHKSRDKPELEKSYWDCTRLRKKECRARAITSLADDDQIPHIYKGPIHEPFHSHPADSDECKAEIARYRIKKEADSHPERPPTAILRDEMRDLTPRVLARLPERENLKRAIRVARRKNLPTNPKKLTDLHDLPERFQKTLTGEKFLIFDTRDEGEEVGRVLVFATRRNLELLKNSDVWFFDGTFKVSVTNSIMDAEFL